MYERAFGTDWDALGRDELLRRAYALGVDARLGNHHEEEVKRLMAVAESSYDGSLIELAFVEGKREARELSTEETAPEEVWTELVEGNELDLDVDRGSGADTPGVPDALRRADPGGRPDDGLDRVRLPDFLVRE